MENMKQDVHKTLKAPENKRKGHLKIFFGYAPGVGTTYSMLKAAHQAKRRGIDVTAGFIEPHARPQTKALLNGLEVMKKLVVAYDGVKRYEFDIDGALDRKPQLILVDDLAHINSPACRHSKRYHDIEELLNSGIDVYTTLNLQNIESLNDMVESITGISEKARIPDYVFDTAHQVELIDIEPQELIDRTKLLNMHDYINKLNADDDYFTVEKSNITKLNSEIRVNTLNIKNTKIEQLPKDMRVNTLIVDSKTAKNLPLTTIRQCGSMDIDGFTYSESNSSVDSYNFCSVTAEAEACTCC